jgi:transcriptional regulator with XRE-family HTH domain
MEAAMGEAYEQSVVAAVLEEALARPGWSQARLARELGLRPQTINKWASGENTPPIERWPAIEEALGIERGTILRRAGYVGDDDAGEGRNLRVDFNSKIARLAPEDQRYVDELVERLLRERDDR